MIEIQEFTNYLDCLDDDKKALALDILEEYCFFKKQIRECQELTLLEISKTGKTRITPAGKMIKEYSNIVDAKRNQLLRLLYKVESSARDDILKKLEEFE